MAETSTIEQIIGTFTGMVAGALATGGLQTIGHQFYPHPRGTGISDADALEAALAAAPPETLIVVLASYCIGTFFGAGIAGWISHGGRMAVTWTTILLLAAGLVNIVLIAHPFWFTALSPLSFLAGGLLAYRAPGAHVKRAA